MMASDKSDVIFLLYKQANLDLYFLISIYECIIASISEHFKNEFLRIDSRNDTLM